MKGKLETSQWMMGPDAIEHYVRYMKGHEDDERVQKFVNPRDGIEKSVLKSLHRRGK